MPSSYRISAPFLSDDERAQAATKGGLSGEESSNTMRGMLLGLQRLPHVYQGPVPIVVNAFGNTITPGRRLTELKITARRARNKVARQSRRINRGK